MSINGVAGSPSGFRSIGEPEVTARPDWGDRVAPSRKGGGIKRYSRFVALMKVTLPLIALGLVGLLAAWPKLGEVHVARATLDRGQIEMLNARYYARDEQNRPFSLTSDSAVQSQENANLTDMVNPVAEMTQVDGTWVTMRSERGRYDQSDGRLLMIDNVHVLRDDGFEFFTALANVDTKGGIAWGDAHVDGQGPSGEINADGFRVYDHGRTVVFLHSPTASVKSGDSGTASKPSNPSKPSKPAQ